MARGKVAHISQAFDLAVQAIFDGECKPLPDVLRCVRRPVGSKARFSVSRPVAPRAGSPQAGAAGWLGRVAEAEVAVAKGPKAVAVGCLAR